MAAPEIHLTWLDAERCELSAAAPAFFVALSCDEPTVLSDNAFTLLPGRPRIVRRLRGSGGVMRIFQLGAVGR